MTNEIIMFLLQGILGMAMLFLGLVLSGMRSTMTMVVTDLKLLNDVVLGKYVTRDNFDNILAIHRTESDSKWIAQRTLDHELRTLITETMIDLAKVAGKPYNYQGEQKDKS